MSLQPLRLDDLTWTQMVDSIRGRIMANSDGRWTMHGSLDPGVTLLELLAYLFEQRIYWLDQVPEPLVRAMLALLDDAPFPTAAAKTVFTFESPEDGSPLQVSEGAVFFPRDRELPIPMTTLQSTTVLPVSTTDGSQLQMNLTAGGHDYSADLIAGRPVPLFPADGSAAELQIIIWLRRHLTASEIDGTFHLLFDLDTAAAIVPEWSPVSKNIQWYGRPTQTGFFDENDPGFEETTSGPQQKVPTAPAAWLQHYVSTAWNYRKLQPLAPAKLQWHYSTGTKTRRAFGGTDDFDGTGGLRRPGLVRLKIADDWKPIDVSGNGAAAYAIWVTCEASTFSSPPMLRRLIPNAAVAQNFKNIEMRPEKINPQIENWLRLPGQTLELEVEEPEPLPEPLETSVKLSLYEIDEKWHEWRPTDHFYHHGPEDRVFVVDRSRKRLMFGNGLNGRIPVLDKNIENPAKLNYRAGGGSRGNVGQLYWTSKESGLRSYNPVPGIGGAEAETMAEAGSRVGGNLSRGERAVTASDFELLAEKTPGIAIARAHAAVGHHPGFPCHPVNGATTVFVVPEVPRDDYLFEAGKAVLAPQTDLGALAAISRLLEARRLIGSEVFVCSAQFRAIYLIVEMKGIFAGENSLQSELTLLLTRYLDPLAGGNGGKGWPFGGPLRPSSFVREIQKHVGENLFVKRVAIALDSRRNFEDCRDVAIEPYELVYLREMRLSIDRTPASRGGLR